MFALEHDPITGEERYRHLETGETFTEKPLSLGSERWDQDDMMLWTVEEVRGPPPVFEVKADRKCRQLTLLQHLAAVVSSRSRTPPVPRPRRSASSRGISSWLVSLSFNSTSLDLQCRRGSRTLHAVGTFFHRVGKFAN